MKICFLSLSAYPILAKRNLGYIGGAELQQVLLAKELATHGYEISFVTYDHGQKDISYIENIEIVKVYEREKAHKISPFAKLRNIWRALNKVKADLYFYSAGSHGVLPFLHLLKRRKFIYRIPSDSIVLRKTENFLASLGQLIDIKNAEAVVVLSEFQRKKLRENFGVEGTVIKNAQPIPKTQPKKSSPPSVLWVGSISHVKRPQMFIELARTMSTTKFEMVGGERLGESELYRKIQSSANELPNLTFYGFVPHYTIDKFFERAGIFVNTSFFEGFPNTFLQSWVYYIPVVSLNVDPDGIIKHENLGFHSENFNRLISDVNYLLHNNKIRKKMGDKARSYVEENHSVEAMTASYIKMFSGIT